MQGKLSLQERVETKELGETDQGLLSCSCKEGRIVEGVLDFRVEEQKKGNQWSKVLKNKSLDELNKDVREKTPQNQFQLQEKTLKSIAKYIKSSEGKLILDIATGRGMLLEKLLPLPHECHVVCVDVSLAMLKAIRARNKKLYPRTKISYIPSDAASLPFIDECFDFVVSYGLANIGAQLIAGMKEAQRVIRKGGKFFNASLLLKPASKSHKLLQKMYGEKADKFLSFMFENGFLEFHKEMNYASVKLEVIGESIAQQGVDPIPVEGDWFAFGVVVSQK